MEKETWTNQILRSTDDWQPAAPDAALFSRIQSRIRQSEFVSPKTVWLAAASIAALVLVNVAAIRKTHREQTVAVAASFDKSNQLYR